MAYTSSFLTHIYNDSPVPLQDFITTLYGAGLKRRKYGKYFREYFRFLSACQWEDFEFIYELQNQKLRQMVKYAHENVPYYQEIFRREHLKPSDIQCAKDLSKVPILEKEVLRKRSADFMPMAYPRKHMTVYHTSGTTGKPLTLYVSKNCFQREYAFRWLHYSWGGIHRGDRIATIAGHPVVPIVRMRPPYWRFNKVENQAIFSSQHISKQSLPAYSKALEDFQPAMIHGYPSSIYLVARHLLESGISGIRPKAVFTASETLLDFQRTAIETAFGCKVFNWYGNTEMVAHATECEKGGMHVQTLHSVLEVLDENGAPVREGDEGNVVGTGLDNFAMPLIRYRVGDVASPSKEKCACGRGYPLVERILGRVEDYVVTPERRYVGRLDHVFKQDLKVKEAQLIQEAPDLLKVRLVKDRGYSEADTRSIIDGLRERLGASMRYSFDFLDEIPRDRSGKFRFVISRIARQ